MSKTKVFCFIRMGRIKDAIKSFADSAALAKALPFEYAYCLYRIGNYMECLTALESCPRELKVKILEAQANYRVEKFEESLSLFQEILEEDSQNDEIRANILAIQASMKAKRPEKKIAVMEDASSFECLYNIGCFYVEAKDFIKAEEYLEMAKEVALNSLNEQNASRDEIEREMCQIYLQLNFIKQMNEKDQSSLQQVAKSLKCMRKLDVDLQTKAIILNNLASLSDASHALKHLKRALMIPALLSHKREILHMNFIIALDASSRKRCIDSFLQKFPNSSFKCALHFLVNESSAKILTKMEASLKANKMKACLDIWESLPTQLKGYNSFISLKAHLLISLGKNEDGRKLLSSISSEKPKAKRTSISSKSPSVVAYKCIALLENNFEEAKMLSQDLVEIPDSHSTIQELDFTRLKVAKYFDF